MAQYNGWTNYETWLVNLWLDNDGVDLTDVCRGHGDTYHKGQAIKDFVEEVYLAEAPTTGMIADLIGSAIGEVNWYEIAEHVEADDEEGDEEEQAEEE